MKLNEFKYPILKSIENNILKKPFDIINENEWDLMRKDIETELKLFDRELKISYITKPIHEKLLEKNIFIKAKDLLKNVPETIGYIILPEKQRPLKVKETEEYDLSEYEYDSLLFSFVNQDTYDLNQFGKIDEEFMEDKEDKEYYLAGRWLTILPIKNGKIIYCLRNSNVSNDEEYGTIHGTETEDAYGNILDYLFSYLIFYNFTETENKTIFSTESGKQRRIKIDNEKFLNESNNDIEIIDTNYFTRIIRTGEFGVSGHFRLQKHGPKNSLTKLIYIEKYKKSGYTKEAKQELKK
jgi:hypothetical protein